MYKELFADEEFYEDESIEEEIVRCPICGCSKFEGNISYVVKMTIDNEGKPNAYKPMDGEFDKEIHCMNCEESYVMHY